MLNAIPRVLSTAQYQTGAKAECRLRSCTPSRSNHHGALGSKSAKRKQACALCFRRPSLPLCAIRQRIALPRSSTVHLQPGERANEEKIVQLRRCDGKVKVIGYSSKLLDPVRAWFLL